MEGVQCRLVHSASAAHGVHRSLRSTQRISIPQPHTKDVPIRHKRSRGRARPADCVTASHDRACEERLLSAAVYIS